MFYHFLVPEGGHPTWEENCFEKNIKIQGPFYKPQSVANIFPYIKYDFLSRIVIIDQS